MSKPLGRAVFFGCLCPALLVHAAAPPDTSQKDSYLLYRNGQVAVRPHRRAREARAPEWQVGLEGRTILPQEQVRTGKASLATLLTGGARLWLDPQTQVMILGPAPRKGPLSVALLSGAARVASAPQSGPAAARGPRLLRLHALDAEINLRGVMRVEFTGGVALLAVYDGEAEVKSKHGGLLKLPAGSGAILRKTGRSQSGGLIGAPRWENGPMLFFALPTTGPARDGGSADPIAVGAPARQAQANLALPFVPVQGAVRYRLEIGRDEALLDRVSLSTLSAETRVATPQLMQKGRYFARLQAVDSDQVAGPGPVVMVEVIEVRGQHLLAAPGVAPAAPLPHALPQQQPLLLGAGKVSFDILPATGKLAVEIDGQSGSAHVDLGRGRHEVAVTSDSGLRGKLLVDISRPSYLIGISEVGANMKSPPGDAVARRFHLDVSAVDVLGAATLAADAGAALPPLAMDLYEVAPSGQAPAASPPGPSAPGRGSLLSHAPGSPGGPSTYESDLIVPAGQVLRLVVRDADGPVVSADLRSRSAE